MNYISSESIKVFPSAFRGTHVVEGVTKPYDPEAFLMTEENLANIGNKITYLKKDYYYYDGDTIYIVLRGYLFVIENYDTIFGELPSDEVGTDVYVGIHLANVESSYDVNMSTLSPVGEIGTNILDNNGTFKGLVWDTQSLGSSVTAQVQIFKAVDNKTIWNPRDMLNISTTQISNGTANDVKSIDEEFTTKQLNVNGNITQTDLTSTLNGVNIRSRAIGFDLSGGVTNKSLDIDANANIYADTYITGSTSIYRPLTIGSAEGVSPAYTGEITIRSKKNLTITGGNTSANQTVTFNGDSSHTSTSFQAGAYSSVETVGSENVTVGGNSFNIVTRDTTQEISGTKVFSGAITHLGTVDISNNTSNALKVAGNVTISTLTKNYGVYANDSQQLTSVNLTHSDPTANTNNSTTLTWVSSVTSDSKGVLSTTRKKTVFAKGSTQGTFKLDSTEVGVSNLGESDSPTFANITDSGLTASQAVSTNANKKLVSTNLTTSSPSASGNSLSYIDTISQSAVGKITATKKSISIDTGDGQGQLKINGTNYNVKDLQTTSVPTFTKVNFSNVRNYVEYLSSPEAYKGIALVHIDGVSTGQPTASLRLSCHHVNSYDDYPLLAGGMMTNLTTDYNSPIMFASNLYPLNSSYALGSSTYLWTNVYATNFRAGSDRRLKENIEDYKPSKSILDLPIRQFDLKADGSHHIGCIAQELQEIAPELVHDDKEGYLTIEETKLVYLLLDEVKKLREELDELKKR